MPAINRFIWTFSTFAHGNAKNSRTADTKISEICLFDIHRLASDTLACAALLRAKRPHANCIPRQLRGVADAGVSLLNSMI
jgi:hypothetical protein